MTVHSVPEGFCDLSPGVYRMTHARLARWRALGVNVRGGASRTKAQHEAKRPPSSSGFTFEAIRPS